MTGEQAPVSGAWQRLAGEAPALAAQVARLLSYQQGTALLATMAEDGAARRDPRCELHSAVCVLGDEELVVRGTTTEVLDLAQRKAIADRQAAVSDWDQRKVVLALAPTLVSWAVWQFRRRRDVTWRDQSAGQATVSGA